MTTRGAQRDMPHPLRATVSPAPGSAPALPGAGQLTIVRDPLQFALFLLSIVTISRIHKHYPVLSMLRPAMLLVLFCAAYAVLAPGALSRDPLWKHWPTRRMAWLGALACASAVFGISLGGSATFIIEEYSKTLVYGFLLAVSIRHARDLYTMVLAYVISSGILVFFAQFVFGLSRSAGSRTMRLSNLYTYDANDLGLMLVVGLALTLWLLPVVRPRWRILPLIQCGLIASAIARSGSRGAFLGLFVFGLGALVLMDMVTVRRRIAVLVVAMGALAVAAPEGYWEQMATVVKPQQDYNMTSTDGRKELIVRGLGYMADYPVFGLGINNFRRAECTISEKAREHVINTRLRCTPPHNSYIQVGAEIGIPGLLVWTSIIFGGIFAMRRLRRRMPAGWRHGDVEARFLYSAPVYLILALLGFAVTSFFLTFAWMDPIYFLAALMTGLYTSVAERMRREDAVGAEAGRVVISPRPGRGGLA